MYNTNPHYNTGAFMSNKNINQDESQEFVSKKKMLSILLTDLYYSIENARNFYSDFIDSFYKINSYHDLEPVQIDSVNHIMNEKINACRIKLKKCYAAAELDNKEKNESIVRLLFLYNRALHGLEDVIDDTDTLIKHVYQMVITGRKNQSVTDLVKNHNAKSDKIDGRKLRAKELYDQLESEFGSFIIDEM